MKRWCVGLLLTVLLGGCVILPWDDDYHGHGHGHGHYWGGHHEGSRNWGGRR